MTSSNSIEPIYVVDTNALIWYLTDSKKLTPLAKSIFKSAEKGETLLYLSAIVIAEMYYVDKKWKLFDDFSSLYQVIRSKPYFKLVPFFAVDVLEFEQYSAVPEMHDRIITGLARRLNAPIITSDVLITKSQLVTVVW